MHAKIYKKKIILKPQYNKYTFLKKKRRFKFNEEFSLLPKARHTKYFARLDSFVFHDLWNRKLFFNKNLQLEQSEED